MHITRLTIKRISILKFINVFMRDRNEIASFHISRVQLMRLIRCDHEVSNLPRKRSNRGMEPLYATIIIVIHTAFIYALTIFGGEHGSDFP